MAGLLYYLGNGNDKINRDDLNQFGIGYAFDTLSFSAVNVSRGPAADPQKPGTVTNPGPPGVVVAADGTFADRPPGYYPDKQRWMRIPEVLLEKQGEPAAGVSPPSEIWVGVYSDAPPTPALLQRRQILNGHAVRLGDAQEYVIPVVRMAREVQGTMKLFSGLPMATSVDERGQWAQAGVMKPYERLWSYACDFWDDLMQSLQHQVEGEAGDTDEIPDTPKIRFEFEESYDAALEALKTNYRLRKMEVALLALFDDLCVAEILCAVVDWPTWVAWNKKKTQTSAG